MARTTARPVDRRHQSPDGGTHQGEPVGMIEVLNWLAPPGLLTAGHHQGELVTMIEALTLASTPGVLTGGIKSLTVAHTKANPWA